MKKPAAGKHGSRVVSDDDTSDGEPPNQDPAPGSRRWRRAASRGDLPPADVDDAATGLRGAQHDNDQAWRDVLRTCWRLILILLTWTLALAIQAVRQVLFWGCVWGAAAGAAGPWWARVDPRGACAVPLQAAGVIYQASAHATKDWWAPQRRVLGDELQRLGGRGIDRLTAFVSGSQQAAVYIDDMEEDVEEENLAVSDRCGA